MAEFDDVFDDDTLSSVLENAFDFLEKAVREYKTEPKYSVINFNTAVELILKARLMHEHWSLIVLKNPDKKKFKAGEFRSLSMDESIEKIEKVLGEDIPAASKEAFSKISKHRNKMVHFYHEANAETAPEELLTEIVIEQCKGWFHLRRLIEKWGKIFPDQQGKIYSINAAMKQHTEYLRVVYDQIKDSIEGEKKKGTSYSTCSSCGYEASRNEETTELLIECACRVCLFKERTLIVDCPQCTESMQISQDTEGEGTCSTCDYEISSEELFELINDEDPSHDQILCGDAFTPANCYWCSMQKTVLEHNEEYLCINCLETGEIGFCGWCNEPQMGGDLEYSQEAGCEFCDGHSGWRKDD